MSHFPNDPLATELGLSSWQHDATVMGAYYSHDSSAPKTENSTSNKSHKKEKQRVSLFAIWLVFAFVCFLIQLIVELGR